MSFHEENPSRTPRWLLAVFVSVFIHVTALISHFSPFTQRDSSLDRSSDDPIEISELPPEYRTPPRQQPRPLPKALPKEMEMAESEESRNKELDPNAKFLSDKNQTAEKEMRAKKTDDFRQAQGTGPKNQTSEEKTAGIAPTGEETAERSDLEVADNEGATPGKQKGVKRDWKTLSLKDLGVGGDGGMAGATDDRLKGVDEGERTILSTREYRYFSYYHRIKELLRQYWKPTVEQRMMRMWEKGKSIGEQEMVTRLLVLLNTDGRIAKISRLTSSGVSEVDDAAIEAFNKAGPFPNPPKGMVEEDGFVRIRWDFILKAEAAPRIQFSNAGRPTP